MGVELQDWKKMLEDRRKCMRFDMPFIIKYKSVKKAAGYSGALTRNFSYEGFSFDAINVNFEPKDTLEFQLKFPQNGTFISFLGDVVWKEQILNRYWAGVRFKEIGEKGKSNLLEKICDYGNVSFDMFVYDKRPESVMTEKETKKFPAKVRKEQKQVEKSFKEQPDTITIKKQYFTSRPVCKVTFRLPKEAAPDAQKVTIVGDFNDWDQENIVMKQLENGDFAVTLNLKLGKEYRYRYLIDGERWENDWNPDRYEPNQFGWHDSVVVV